VADKAVVQCSGNEWRTGMAFTCSVVLCVLAQRTTKNAALLTFKVRAGRAPHFAGVRNQFPGCERHAQLGQSWPGACTIVPKFKPKR